MNSLTKRELFAAMAMQGLISNPKLADILKKEGPNWIEKNAYLYGDALIRKLDSTRIEDSRV